MSSDKKAPSRFVSDSIALMGGQIIISLFSLGTVIITARALDPHGRGQFSLALLLANIIFMFSEFGLGTAGMRLMAAGTWPRPQILGSHVFAITVRILVAGFLGFALVLLAHETFFPGVPNEYLLLGILQIIPLMVSGSILPLLLGVGLAKTYNRILVLSSMLALGSLSIGWVIIGLNVRTALLLQLGAGFIMSLIICRKTIKASGGVAWPNFRYLVEAYRFGIGIYASSVLSFANMRLIWLIINSFIGVTAVGLYTIAQTATERIYLISDALATILFPRIAEDPESNSSRITPTVFRIALITGALLAIGLAIVADWLVRLFFTDSFAGAVPVMRLLLVAVVFSSGWRVLSQDLNGRGYSQVTAFVNGAATVLGLGLAILLIPRLNLEGAAWSAIAAAAMSMIAGVLLFGYYSSSTHVLSELFIPSTREWQFAAQLMRGNFNVLKHGGKLWWALTRAYMWIGDVIVIFKHCLWKYIKAIYWVLETLRRKIFGTYIDELLWKKRIPTLSRDYAESLNCPHRKWLIDRILSEGSISAIIEVGCGCGPNLHLLAHQAPHIKLIGIDISPALLAEGAAHFSSLGLEHIRLVEGQADHLIDIADASADVVFTDAMLLYVGPDKISRVIKEMIRVARKRVVMLEMHEQGSGIKGRYTRDGWLRDYKALLSLYVGSDAVHLEKLPHVLRNAGRWPEYGTLINVDLTKKEKEIEQ